MTTNPVQTTTPPNLPALAREIRGRLERTFPLNDLHIQQVLCLAEEVGEFVAAFRRAVGMARRGGPWEHVEEELADVVIAAYVAGAVLGIDLDAAVAVKAQMVMARGLREGQ